jgi:hypothetical protein
MIHWMGHFVKINQYFPYNAQILEDGVLRVGWCGTHGRGLCTGVYDVSPDNPDYKFWLWVETGARSVGSAPPTVGMDEQTISQMRRSMSTSAVNNAHLLHAQRTT